MSDPGEAPSGYRRHLRPAIASVMVLSAIMIALVAVFLGGLMIGRTPEYLGKKRPARETRLTVLYALLTPAVVLVLTGIALVTQGRPSWTR